MNKSFRVFCWVDLGSSFRKSEHYPILFSSAKGFRLPRSSYELAWNVLQEVPLALHIFFFQQNSQAIFECETKVLIIVSGLMGPATSATLNQSDANLLHIMTRPLAFSRAFGSSLVFPVSFHWLPVIFCFALIGCWSYSRYGVRSLIEVRIERFETIAESYWNLKTMFILRQPGMFQFFYPLLTVTLRKSFSIQTRHFLSCLASSASLSINNQVETWNYFRGNFKMFQIHFSVDIFNSKLGNIGLPLFSFISAILFFIKDF